MFRRLFVALLTAGVTFRAAAHDMYREWKQPYTGASCCSEADCHPTRAWLDDGGDWIALHKGEPVRIPWARVMKGPSPDGRSHICISDSGVVHCFMPAPMMG